MSAGPAQSSAPAAAAPVASATSAPGPGTTPTSSKPPAEAMPSGIPAAGDGPDGDPAIQAAFTKDHPSDLTPADASQLTALGADVWLAETTGAGRVRWATYFPTAQGAAPGRLYSGVRVQAAAAHTEQGHPDRARVDLLWAGTSPIGEYGDHRPASVSFTRTATGWEPTR